MSTKRNPKNRFKGRLRERSVTDSFIIIMLLVRRKLSHLLFPCSSPSSTAARRITLIFTSVHHPRFSTTTETQNPPQKPSFIVGYLINSCGLSPEKALEASKRLIHINSPTKPDAVLRFLRRSGLADTHIKNLISKYPDILRSNVEKTLRPRLRALQELGLSESEILKAAVKNHYLFSCSLGKRIVPNISLLRESGISNAQIGKMIICNPRSITSSPGSLRAAVDRSEELGVSRKSGMFWQMLKSAMSITPATLDAKIKFLKSLGWSESEILCAIRKVPRLMNLSAKKVSSTLEFLVKEVGCDLSYVAGRPLLLCLSLEKRLVPRHSVMSTLKSKGLIVGERGLASVAALTDDMFIKKFILPFEDKVPGLHVGYVAACSVKAPTNPKLG